MTYRAVPGHFPLGMAGDAEAHPIHVVHLKHLRHALDLAMTGATGVGSQRLDVALVRKVRVSRQVMDPDPFDRLLLGPGLPHLLDLRLMRAVPPAYYQMTAHAGLHRWDAGLGRYRHRVVAVLALNLVLAGVDVVAEEDRLARTLQTSTVGSADDGSSYGIGSGFGLLGAGTGNAEREEGSQASGCNATDDECQLTHHHLTAREDSGPASAKCAPKYSAASSLHNPTTNVIRHFSRLAHLRRARHATAAPVGAPGVPPAIRLYVGRGSGKHR